jgi:hypothetical protein
MKIPARRGKRRIRIGMVMAYILSILGLIFEFFKYF